MFVYAFVADEDLNELNEADRRDLRPGMLAATWPQWRRYWLAYLATKLPYLDKLADLIEVAQRILEMIRQTVVLPRFRRSPQ